MLSLIQKNILFVVLFLSLSLFSATAFAHEVYVLETDDINTILNSESTNPFTAVQTNELEFFTWGFIALMTVVIVFFVSIARPVEKIFDPILFNLKRKFGFVVIRLTIGLAVFTSGYFGALFGPELPLSLFFSPYEQIASVCLMILGALILLGLFTRIAGLIALLVTFYAIYVQGWYIFTYSNYIGEILFVAFLGAHVWSLDKHVFHWHGFLGMVERFMEKYAFLLLRITFGVSLIYASVFAKFIHSELALRTVIDYNLTDYFHFEPMFIVLGAGIIEITIGIFIIIGFEVRFASLFLMVFITLSLLYFGEAVWPHIILFGGALALFIHGYDRFSIEGYFFKNAQHEPVL